MVVIMPQWARQVTREQVSKLYSLNAMGIYDDELVDEVAYAMLARAESIMKVTKAHGEGILECPVCSSEIRCDGKRYICGCGWNTTCSELHKTYKKKQLVGGAALPIIDAAFKSFPAMGTYTDKMLWIDSLIHTFHGEIDARQEKTGLAYRPVARNFIAGSLAEVVELIFSLAYGDSPDFAKSRAKWLEKLKISYVPDYVKKITAITR